MQVQDMNTVIGGSSDAVERTIDRERALITEAIGMVASGSAPRVTVASLRFGEALLPEARAIAKSAGVHVTALWTLDQFNHAISVEPGLD